MSIRLRYWFELVPIVAWASLPFHVNSFSLALQIVGSLYLLLCGVLWWLIVTICREVNRMVKE